jgi:V/A-type H+-transporting ATPase subunit I
MRVDVKKFLFIGFHADRELFFRKAQEAGCIHFIEKNGTKRTEVPQDLQDTHAAIKVLRSLPVASQEEFADFDRVDKLVSRILELKHKVDKLHEESRVLNLDIARIEIFGDFNLEDLRYIEREGKRKIQFFAAKEGTRHDIIIPEEMLYIASDHGLDYFVAINPVATAYDKMTEIQIDKSLNELKHKLVEVQSELHVAESELKSYSKYNTYLHRAFTNKLNIYNLKEAQNEVGRYLDDTLFAVQGWVPLTDIPIMEALVHDLNIHAEEIAIEDTDEVPTYLENQGFAKIGEDLVQIYDTPSPEDKDPSLWVLGFFALFFAMIINDGGYGFIFLAIAGFIKYKYPDLKANAKRFLRLLVILGSFCIGWGILTNSFFGINIDLDNPLRKVSVMNWLIEKKVEYQMKTKGSSYQEWVKHFPEIANAKTPQEFIRGTMMKPDGKVSYELIDQYTRDIMLEVALLVGIIHLVISLARYLPRRWGNFGWILFLIGGYLYVPYFIDATSLMQYAFGVSKSHGAREGFILMVSGPILASVLGVLNHGWIGLTEIMHSVQVFADVMSYLRIYALGLAAAMVSIIINEMAGELPLAIGVFVLLFGHTINIIIGTGLGTIHGLRLNFLEWYHYSFDGGGKAFKPLRLMDTD